MIDDGIVEAIDHMIDLCSDPAQQAGMISLREMLCDYYDGMTGDENFNEWLQGYLSC